MTRHQSRALLFSLAAIGAVIGIACASAPSPEDEMPRQPGVPRQPVKTLPGISVLLRDSLELIAGKKIGILTNQTGIDENRVSDIDRLTGASGGQV